MKVRTREIDLGWDVAGYLNLLLLQPAYEIEGNEGEIGRIRAGCRSSQQALVDAVARVIASPKDHVPPGFRPLHAVVLPELAVPRDRLDGLLEAVSRAPADPGVLIVAGIEGLSCREYETLVRRRATHQDWKDAEIESVQSAADPAAVWVNAMLIAWRDSDEQLGVTFQRKLTSSALERGSLRTGDAIHILIINGAAFAFTICSDMLHVPTDGATDRCSVAEGILEHFRTCGEPRTLDAIFHIQHNPRPDHPDMQAAFRGILVDSPPCVREALCGTMVVRVNAAAKCEECCEYGLTGIMVGGHRRYGTSAPGCCRRLEGNIVRYDLRPRRASAFLLKTRLPSRTPGPNALVSIQPVTEGRWIGLRRQDSQVDFTSNSAAEPEAYRFAAWKAFPHTLHASDGVDLLEPSPDNPARQALHQHLKDKYGALRRVCWGLNAECLCQWAKRVFALGGAHMPHPDDWDSGHIDRLRHLVAGLAMIHACTPLQASHPGGGGATPAALRLARGGQSVHSREACGRIWGNVTATAIQEDVEACSPMDNDIYVIAGYSGHAKTMRLRLGGLVLSDAPTYDVQEQDLQDDIARAEITLVPVDDIVQRVRVDGADDLGQIDQWLDDILTGQPRDTQGVSVQ